MKLKRAVEGRLGVVLLASATALLCALGCAVDPQAAGGTTPTVLSTTTRADVIGGWPCGGEYCPFIEFAVLCPDGTIVFGGGSICVEDGAGPHCEDVLPECPGSTTE